MEISMRPTKTMKSTMCGTKRGRKQPTAAIGSLQRPTLFGIALEQILFEGSRLVASMPAQIRRRPRQLSSKSCLTPGLTRHFRVNQPRHGQKRSQQIHHRPSYIYSPKKARLGAPDGLLETR